MIQLGKFNTLTIVRFTDHGAYLDGGDVGEVLMPKAYVRREMRPGQEVRVFVYLDQSERLVGTTETPLAQVGEFAVLRVAWVNEYGAFLHWGLMKDLFVPFREQKREMQVGETHLVYVYVDEETQRIAATAKVDKRLRPARKANYHRGATVSLLIGRRTPLGWKVIVDNAHAGIVYEDQVFGEPPRLGSRREGTVVEVRRDGKLDISLQPIGKSRFRDFADTLLDELAAAPGHVLPFSDASAPEDIAARFSVSKKTFKRAVGTLLKAGRIGLTDDGIALLQ